MLINGTKRLLALGAAAIGLLSLPSVAAAQTWTPLKNPMPFLCQGGGGDAPLLLTDGSVLVQDSFCSDYWRLVPDNTGSYINGTWVQAASLPAGYGPEARSAAVLPDGRAIVEGGEYNLGQSADTAQGAIFDPVANTWTPVTPPSFFGTCCGYTQTIGDGQSVVLSDGRYMQANCCGNLYTGLPPDPTALLDPKTLTWTPTGTNKADQYVEEGWTLLPNGKVLTVDANNTADLTNSEIFDPSSGSWSSAGSTIVKLDDTNADGTGSHEIGPQVLRPDGTVIAFGATGPNAVYNSRNGSWAAATDFPVVATGQLDVADGPAALLPDGNVLVASSPGVYNSPTYFFEFTTNNKFNPSVAPPLTSPTLSSYDYVMLVLPTGQVLMTSRGSDLEIYTPAAGATFKDEWRPTVAFTPFLVEPGESYKVYGFQFNGLSQGAAYGDDEGNATNYPLVRITNLETGHVFYSRTHDHSSMAVASKHLVSTHFDVPATQEKGWSKLEVVANGIPSLPVYVLVR